MAGSPRGTPPPRMGWPTASLSPAIDNRYVWRQPGVDRTRRGKEGPHGRRAFLRKASTRRAFMADGIGSPREPDGNEASRRISACSRQHSSHSSRCCSKPCRRSGGRASSRYSVRPSVTDLQSSVLIGRIEVRGEGASKNRFQLLTSGHVPIGVTFAALHQTETQALPATNQRIRSRRAYEMAGEVAVDRPWRSTSAADTQGLQLLLEGSRLRHLPGEEHVPVVRADLPARARVQTAPLIPDVPDPSRRSGRTRRAIATPCPTHPLPASGEPASHFASKIQWTSRLGGPAIGRAAVDRYGSRISRTFMRARWRRTR